MSVTPSEDSPIVAPRRKTKRIAIVTSSPDKSKAERKKRSSPAAVAVEEDDSVILVQEHAKPKRLRRAQDEGEIRETRRTKQRHRPDLGIFLDTAAVNSDNEDTASDTDEDIEPETYVGDWALQLLELS